MELKVLRQHIVDFTTLTGLDWLRFCIVPVIRNVLEYDIVTNIIQKAFLAI